MTVTVTSIHAPPEAQARWRNHSMRDFCMRAPNFCAFVCHDPEGCWNLPDGMVCESRRGTLIVSEGEGADGGTTSYHTNYSLCWYPAGPGTSWQPPDPEVSYVPEWPGDLRGAKCLSCKTKERSCRGKAERGEENCIKAHRAEHRSKCRNQINKHDFPKDRFGRKLEPSSKRCKRIIQLKIDLTETDTTTDPITRRRLQQEVRKCKNQLLRECVAEFEEDHPSESTTRGGGFWMSIKDILGFEVEGSKTIQWGATTGFATACHEAVAEAKIYCSTQRAECESDVDPSRHCN